MTKKQIDKDKANDTAISQLSLSYNEVHSLELGLYLGVIISLVYTHVNPTISIILLYDVAVSSIGFSITANVLNTILDNKAFRYTIKAEPWYYIGSLTISFIVSLLVQHYII